MIGDEQLYQIAVVFAGEWDVVPRGPGGSDAATTNLGSTGLFTFNLNSGNFPTSDKYPYKMAIQFDMLANNIEGGAMLCESPSVEGKVYAVKGRRDTSFAVGTYKLVAVSDEPPVSSITTHGGKLMINGKPANSWMSGNKLHWTRVDQMQDGYVEFSPDGTRIINSSFGCEGYRDFATKEDRSSDLNLTMLLNMNPYRTDSNGQSVELVQQNAMSQFYKIIQYYMPEDMLHNFIAAAQPPDLGDVQDIAEDNEANRDFMLHSLLPILQMPSNLPIGTQLKCLMCAEPKLS